GAIADGTYDLAATHQYGTPVLADGYTQSTIRFFSGATQAEQIDQAIPYSFADQEPPHRLMTVAADGTTLQFAVTCPDHTQTIVPSRGFIRGYTVRGSEVWLFQRDSILVYALRP